VDAAPAPAFPVPPLDEGELVDGVRVFRLRLETGSVEWVSGFPTATYGANGAFLGPSLHFRRGERVRIEVTNALEVTTTLHWHGMEVPSASDGGPYQTIAAGATWVAELDVTQRAMTAWYHPHQMHETARHVYMGIAGVIVVDDDAQAVELPSTYGVDDLPLVIQDRRFAADGTHPYSPGHTPAMHDMMAGLRGETMLVNGVRQLRGVVPRGLVRLRVLNGSNARAYNLGFGDGRSFVQIAGDGGLLAAPVTTTRMLLAPGASPPKSTSSSARSPGATVALASYSGEVFSQLFTGTMGGNVADALDRTTFELMTFEVGAAPATSLTPPTTLPPIERLTADQATVVRPIVLSMTGPSVAINGARMTELGDAVPAAINFRIPNGTVERWDVSNDSFMLHPLHLHNRHFQILDIDGQPPPIHLAGWKDTVLVAPGQVVRLMVRFDGTSNATLPYMFHCHILEHEDMGMMGQFYLVDP
ncbi:MAG: multicopper oxidase domain-containing protein, partial [Kofleriaceae bacterium]